jgi:signal transduction histidine kinase
VFGFGGLLPSGNLFAFIHFSKIQVSRKTVELFKLVAASIKLLLLPFDYLSVLDDQVAIAGPSSVRKSKVHEQVQLLMHQRAAMDELLAVQEQLVARHSLETQHIVEQLRRHGGELKQSQKALRESHRAIRHRGNELKLLADHLLLSHEEDRRRLSQELHDNLNQKLAMLANDLEAIQEEWTPEGERILKPLRSFRNRLVDLSREVRQLAYYLHPATLDHLGLTVTLQGFLDEFAAREEIIVHFMHKSVSRHLPQTIQLCLFRVLQESMRNVAKHAHAPSVIVSLKQSPKGISLTVNDSGKGLTESLQKNACAGLGILSMKERVSLVGGKFSVRSYPGRGVHVRAWVPLTEGWP